jgi:predicted heme/steroid binding protein
MADPEIRQRKPAPDTSEEKKASPSPAALAKAEDHSPFNWLDIARSLVFLFLLSGSVSYFVTRESFVWNLQRPKWTNVDVIKSWIVSRITSPVSAPIPNLSQLQIRGEKYQKTSKANSNATFQEGPKQYTDADLKAYDGTNPDLPILLAVNGTIYDVSKGRKHYGPGGSYHFFAGADASRAFVTGCFDTDISPDMRGVEEMFLPHDDPEVDALYTKAELKIAKERERREARREVHEKLKHWYVKWDGVRGLDKLIGI